MASAKPRTKPYEARLLRLAAWILSSESPVPREAIYRKLGYDGSPDAQERKFSRDKDALKRLGLVVEAIELGEDRWGYTIDPHASMLRPIDLSAEEAAAAWTAGVAALRLSTHPLRGELEAALRKLVVGARGLPPRAAATDELARDDAGDDDGERHLGALTAAWEKRRRVRMEYWRAGTGEVSAREVDVYGWARRRGEWIFVGHCHLRQGVRIFYLSRVRELKLAPRDPQRVKRGLDGDYDIPEDFDIRAWSRQQIWDYDVHPPVEATVRFRGSLAAIAHHLVPGARLARDGEGGKTARVQVRNLRGLVRQALAWGPDAELTSPPEARAIAREILAATIPSSSWGTP